MFWPIGQQYDTTGYWFWWHKKLNRKMSRFVELCQYQEVKLAYANDRGKLLNVEANSKVILGITILLK